MNRPDQVDATIDEMERALGSLLVEIINMENKLSPASAEALKHTLYARSGPAPTAFKTAVNLIASSPIDGSLRFSIRSIGQGLFHQLQSPEKMVHIAKRICSQDEPNWSKRMTIIDAAWTGIGSDARGYW